MTRCKVGDMAIVLRDPFPENIGRIVKVIDIPHWPDGIPSWYCRAAHGEMTIINVRDGRTYRHSEGDICDADLLPISGVPVADDATIEMRCKEPA